MDDPPQRIVRVEWAIISESDPNWFRAGVSTVPAGSAEPPAEIAAAMEDRKALHGEPPDDLMTYWNFETQPIRVRS